MGRRRKRKRRKEKKKKRRNKGGVNNEIMNFISSLQSDVERICDEKVKENFIVTHPYH